MKTKVLAVDDMKSVRAVLRTHLELAGFEVYLAEGGEQALELARKEQPEVVLLDVMMPVMDGMEVCRRLREDPFTADIYIIMLTARDSTGAKVEGLDVGADDYMTKPFEPDELFARIRRGCKIHQARHSAMYDALTGLFNRRSFDGMLVRELSRANRHGHPLCMVMVDIDHFKNVNDTYGHQAGDVVLSELATLLRVNVRVSDLPCRWGGEEFVLLFPDTQLDGAMQKAETMRAAVEGHFFRGVGHLTASFGVAELAPGEDGQAFLSRVDKALYQAKETGRNRVVGLQAGEEGSV